jgi:hypothetical protein
VRSPYNAFRGRSGIFFHLVEIHEPIFGIMPVRNSEKIIQVRRNVRLATALGF